MSETKKARLKAAGRDVIGVAGAGLVSYGAWLVYPPAGFVVGGAILLAAAYFLAVAAAE